jgi:hypothetical protein
LHSFDFEFSSNAGERAQHCGRPEFVYFRRRERGPARLAIAGLTDKHDARAKIQYGTEVRPSFAIAEYKQKDVELAGHLAQQIKDPHRASVRERERVIRTHDRDSAAARRKRPAFDFRDPGRINRAILLPWREPAGTKKDSVA